MLTASLLRTGLRDLARRPLHTALMVLGVALGVSVVIAIDLANESARRGFARSAEAVTGRATHRVVGGPHGVPVSVLRQLRLMDAEALAPVVEASAIAEGLGGHAVRLLGIDPLGEGRFRDHIGRHALELPGLERLFTEERGCVVSGPSARRHGLMLGSPLRLRVDGRILDLRVLGLIEPGSAEQAEAIEGLVLLDVGVAQRALAMGDRLSRIDVIASDAQASALAAALPAGLRLARASEQADAIGQLTAAFRLNLTALSLLALVVGMFLIYNTVTFSVVQRRGVFGTLRALGVTPGQLFSLILVEAAAAGAVGTLLGHGLGWVLGHGAIRLVTRTINDLYYTLPVTDASLEPATVLKASALGVGSALLAAFPPAVEASRVEPVTALRPSTLDSAARRWLPWVSLAGVVLGTCGAATLWRAGQDLWLSFAGLFGVVLGFALTTPLLTLGLMATAGPLLGGVLGVLGRVGARTVARSIGRTGVAVAALTTAVSVTIGVGLMIGSFRATVANWLEATLRADLYIGASSGGVRATPALPDGVLATVRGVPGVAEIETYRRVRVMSALGEVLLGATSAASDGGPTGRRFAPGSAVRPFDLVREGAVVVSEPFAHRHGLPPSGASIVLLTDRGEIRFPVVGVFYDYSTEEGTILMSRDVYDRYWADRGVSSLAISVGPGQDVASVVERLRAALAGTAVQITPNRTLKRAVMRIFDRTFAVTNALRVLAVVVAFIGVWSALLSLQVERRREVATLQALGLTPGQLTVLSLIETGLMGLAAGVLSLPLGFALAAILVEVINVRSFGWSMELQADPWQLAQAVAVSVGASLFASVYPLYRQRRTSIAAGLRQE